jgi:FkbM family methyltransferase
MLRNLIRNAAVGLFGMVAQSGVHRLPGLDRVFLMLYEMYKAYFEAGPIYRLRELVPAGSLVIDVGANVGFFSLRFAEWVGDRGKVISVEPEDRNHCILLSTLKQKGLVSRVHAVKAVAANKAGEMFLELNPLHPADHKLSRNNSGLPVTAVTLDDLVPEPTPYRPALVKIDVQGAEMLVLEGAARVLSEARPALFVELHEESLNRFGTSISAILDHLREYGYEAHWLVRSGGKLEMRPQRSHHLAYVICMLISFLIWAAPVNDATAEICLVIGFRE